MWARIIEIALGIWLMAAPAILSFGDPAATSNRIVGPLVASFSVIALWEATRSVRWANAPLALWLIIGPFVIGFGTMIAVTQSVASGALLGLLVFVRGRLEKSYGGGWRALVSSDPPHDRVER